MIKGLILDIDGVLIGEKIGYNSPFPHPDVTQKLKDIHATGMPVVLCTGKPHYAVGKLIKDCGLDNPHITDGGAVIIDPITNTIVKKHALGKQLVRNMLKTFLDADMYVEVYTPNEYIIQKNQYRDILTTVHTHILQTQPRQVDALIEEADRLEVIKIMPVATDKEDEKRLQALFAPFADDAILSMGVHPVANPHQFGLITKQGISKRQSALDATQALGIPIAEYLGAGDSTSDWSFMELTNVAATLKNGSEKLKNLVAGKESRGYVAKKSVDENGILEVFDYFQL